MLPIAVTVARPPCDEKGGENASKKRMCLTKRAGRRGRRPLQTRVAFPPRLFVFRNKVQGWATDGRPHDFSCQNNSSSRRRRISHAVGIFHARSAFHPTTGRISPRHREVTPAPTPTNESSVSVSVHPPTGRISPRHRKVTPAVRAKARKKIQKFGVKTFFSFIIYLYIYDIIKNNFPAGVARGRKF